MALLDNALTTVEQVKQFYPTITTNFTDPDIEYLINSISGFFETYCNRKFNEQPKEEKTTGNHKRVFYVKQYPIVSIQEVLLDEVDITSDVNDETTEDELLKGALYYDDGFVSCRRGLIIKYTHGYITRPVAGANPNLITLPYDLELLCLRLIVNAADDILSQNSNIESGGSTGAGTLKGFSITDVKWSFGSTGSEANNKRGTYLDVPSYLTPGDKALMDLYSERII